MNRTQLAGCILFLLVLAGNLSATIFHTIDSTSPLKCSLSFRHHNRVQVLEGRVRKIISPTGRLSIVMEEDSGQAFIYSSGPVLGLITVTIVTDSGTVQDLEVTLEDKSSEVIVLREAKDPEVLPEAPTSLDGDLQPIAMELEAVFSGSLPPGYGAAAYDPMEWTIGPKVTVARAGLINGPSGQIWVLKITNKGKREAAVRETDLSCNGCRWVRLDKDRLRRGESTMAHVAVERT